MDVPENSATLNRWRQQRGQAKCQNRITFTSKATERWRSVTGGLDRVNKTDNIEERAELNESGATKGTSKGALVQ